MFPFIIKGKVPLGLRRDYHLSESGLQERIAERLVQTVRRSEMRTDGSHSGDGRGLVAGGLSRLRSLGFLTAVRVRKVRILSRDDFLFAGYEMDATTTTLVSMVIVPLVLGSILFLHSAFSFYEALMILAALVITSWGLDVFVLVMMLRHEITQIAAEIRAIMKNRDVGQIDIHHRDLPPEDLLTTAYYYERNGLVRRCEAYLAHLTLWYPGSFEADLAREHLQRLEGLPGKNSRRRTREGEREARPSSGGPGFKKAVALLSGWIPKKGPGDSQGDQRRGAEKGPRKRFSWPGLFKRSGPEAAQDGPRRKRPEARYRTDEGDRAKRWLKPGVRETAHERVVRKRRERLQRREAFATAPREEDLTRVSGMKRRLLRLLSVGGREERSYRKKQERWLHGPPPPKPAVRAADDRHDRRQRRPVWMRSREERQAIRRQERWSQDFKTPGRIQRSRDRWGRMRLLTRAGREERHDRERRRKAVLPQPGQRMT